MPQWSLFAIAFMMVRRQEVEKFTIAENSLINFDSFEKTLKSELKFELKRRTKDAIMSLYKDGPQLVNLSHFLFVSTMNASELADVSEFDLVHSRNEIGLFSTVDSNINKTAHPNGFPISNHNNVTACSVRIENIENTRRDTEYPNVIKSTNTRERKETAVNTRRKIAYRKKNHVCPSMNEDTTTYE